MDKRGINRLKLFLEVYTKNTYPKTGIVDVQKVPEIHTHINTVLAETYPPNNVNMPIHKLWVNR